MLKRFIKKASFLEKILIGLMIIILLLSLLPKREGFTEKKNFKSKQNEELFDEFYAKHYDLLLFSDKKNKYEIVQIDKFIKLQENSAILDAGCGTGHQVELFNKEGFNCIGVDKSPAMIKKAQENYPDNEYYVNDFMNSQLYEPDTFDLITSFYFTIYYIQDKKRFFKNCLKWIKPGGYLVVHLVNREKFDPIIPPSNPLKIVSPQKYAKERITNSIVHFKDFKYTANFDYKPDDNLAFFKEKFKFKKEKKVRENEHRLYMEKHDVIVSQVKKSGFVLYEKINLMPVQYEDQFLYLFKKPEH